MNTKLQQNRNQNIMSESLIDLNRSVVLSDYHSAINRNKEAYIKGDVKAGRNYIYPNQIEDAEMIINKFYETNIRAISIVKRTKVGMDGLMISLAVKLSTHPDDNFVIHRDKLLFFTGMSNTDWENDMKDKIPACFKSNIYHHGKLQKSRSILKNIRDTVIFIDEIDTGDKEGQKLHTLLKECGILDIRFMEENNVRFIFVSATMVSELRDLYKWGDTHYIYHMTIPDSYIGHNEFLDRGIIQEFYPINDYESAEKWVVEDILQNYGKECRVHLIRIYGKHVIHIHNACIRNDIEFRNHTSVDRISHEELSNIFDNISRHVVIAIKGFYRRSNLIPDKWKMLIGATHERYIGKFDTNVQVQGFPGRMTGYWKYEIENGHKTGPHRTSIAAINQYEEFYKNPLTETTYNTSNTKRLMVNPTNIKNLNFVESPNRINNPNMHVPIIIEGFSKTDTIFTKGIHSKKKIEFIKSVTNNTTYQRLYNFICKTNVVCSQISNPKTDKSYEKHITKVVNASKNNRPYSIDLTDEKKGVNNWQCFIDCREYRLCFVIWTIDSLLY